MKRDTLHRGIAQSDGTPRRTSSQAITRSRPKEGCSFWHTRCPPFPLFCRVRILRHTPIHVIYPMNLVTGWPERRWQEVIGENDSRGGPTSASGVSGDAWTATEA